MLSLIGKQNGKPEPVLPPDLETTGAKAKKRGRDYVEEAINLRVHVASRLRERCLEAGLDPEHYGSAAVTSQMIALEKLGVRGIPSV